MEIDPRIKSHDMPSWSESSDAARPASSILSRGSNELVPAKLHLIVRSQRHGGPIRLQCSATKRRVKAGKRAQSFLVCKKKPNLTPPPPCDYLFSVEKSSSLQSRGLGRAIRKCIRARPRAETAERRQARASAQLVPGSYNRFRLVFAISIPYPVRPRPRTAPATFPEHPELSESP